MRENSQGKHVLNLLAYTCGFSVAAIEGDAESVMNVDMALGSQNVGRQNQRLNRQYLQGVSDDKTNIFNTVWAAETMRALGPADL